MSPEHVTPKTRRALLLNSIVLHPPGESHGPCE